MDERKAATRLAAEELVDCLLCSICLNTLCKPITLHCGHTFCAGCIQKWTRGNNSCPCCRSPTLSYRSYRESVVLRQILRRFGLITMSDESFSDLARRTVGLAAGISSEAGTAAAQSVAAPPSASDANRDFYDTVDRAAEPLMRTLMHELRYRFVRRQGESGPERRRRVLQELQIRAQRFTPSRHRAHQSPRSRRRQVSARPSEGRLFAELRARARVRRVGVRFAFQSEMRQIMRDRTRRARQGHVSQRLLDLIARDERRR